MVQQKKNPKWCTWTGASKMRTLKGTPTTLFILLHQNTISLFSLLCTNTLFTLLTHTRPHYSPYYTKTRPHFSLCYKLNKNKRQHYQLYHCLNTKIHTNIINFTTVYTQKKNCSHRVGIHVSLRSESCVEIQLQFFFLTRYVHVCLYVCVCVCVCVCARACAVCMHVCVYLDIGVYRPSSRHAAICLRNGLRELETKKNYYPKKIITMSQWPERERGRDRENK